MTASRTRRNAPTAPTKQIPPALSAEAVADALAEAARAAVNAEALFGSSCEMLRRSLLAGESAVKIAERCAVIKRAEPALRLPTVDTAVTVYGLTGNFLRLPGSAVTAERRTGEEIPVTGSMAKRQIEQANVNDVRKILLESADRQTAYDALVALVAKKKSAKRAAERAKQEQAKPPTADEVRDALNAAPGSSAPNAEAKQEDTGTGTGADPAKSAQVKLSAALSLVEQAIQIGGWTPEAAEAATAILNVLSASRAEAAA